MILVVDNSIRDATRFSNLLGEDQHSVIVCDSGSAAERAISEHGPHLAAAIILWEIPGPPFGFELLAICRRTRSDLPVVIVSGMLDVALAARARILGAQDFLEKPLESERVRSCLRALLADEDPLSPLVLAMRQRILGESPALLATLKQIAKHIVRPENILLSGESGTGKELLAQSIHQFGSRPEEPWVAVNVAVIPKELIESALFGHEKGAFTGAGERHVGFLEESNGGTLFLDEIGELEMPLQAKLLRVIQEREFRRLKGSTSLPFAARLVCATNVNLTESVKAGRFRQDLYHRIAEITIRVPALREREGDVELLIKHFLAENGDGRQPQVARETLTLLRGYPYPGNIRELQNIIKSAVIEADGKTILPQHLPLETMGALLEEKPSVEASKAPEIQRLLEQLPENLLQELRNHLPKDWLSLPYREALQSYERAFDRIYLSHQLTRSHHKVTKAAEAANIDTKTFRKKWRDSGLPPLTAGEETPDG